MPFSPAPGVSLTPDTAARNTIQPLGDFAPLTLKESTGQTEPVLIYRNPDDTIQQQVQPDGTLVLGQSGSNRIKLSVPDPDIQSIIMLEQVNATSANYFSNQNGNQLSIHSNGRFGATVLDASKPSFQLLLSPGLGDSRLNVDDGTNGAATLQYWHRESSGAIIQPYLAAHKGLVVRGRASQSGNLTEWQDSGGTALSSVSSTGTHRIPKGSATNLAIRFPGSDPSSNTGFYENNDIVTWQSYFSSGAFKVDIGNAAVDVHGGTSATYKLNGRGIMTEPTPTALVFGSAYRDVYMDPTTGTTPRRCLFFGSGSEADQVLIAYSDHKVAVNLGMSTIPDGALHVQATGTTMKTLVAKAIAAQTANLTEWQDSAGAVLMAIEADGDLRTSRTAAATTLGSVTRRWPIYDAAGTLLGYLPLYDAIT